MSDLEKVFMEDRQALRNPIKLIILDPGHFHACLVQKDMYEQVDPLVHVYAPEGEEVAEYRKQVRQFNHSGKNPTLWQEAVYLGPDYLERMLAEKPGNVLLIAGKNSHKTHYIHSAVKHGVNVLADKPMIINPQEYVELEEAFLIAKEKGVLLYDIMTERYEITNILQQVLSRDQRVFGNLEMGTIDNPAVYMQSIHHFHKLVARNTLIRPPWVFDIAQQGAGIVDVSTHLVDLIMWACFPNEPIEREQVEVLQGDTWSTPLTPEQFQSVTQKEPYPENLHPYLDDDSTLNVLCNGDFTFTLRGVHAKISVLWDYQAPQGAGDSHYAIMRGTRANLVVRQDRPSNFIPTLYVAPVPGGESCTETDLKEAIEQICKSYPGIDFKKAASGWEIVIPTHYRVGHEAHFKQVTEKYLQYLEQGQLPRWETQNILTKYFIIMEAYKKSQRQSSNRAD